MSKSRRQFLTHLSASFLGTAALTSLSRAQQTSEPPAGAPPAFGTAPPVGPDVTTSTFAEAEKLMQFELSGSERSQAAGNWRSAMAPLYERRTGPRKVEIEPTLPPYSRWDPILPGQKTLPQRDEFIWSKSDPGPLPSNDEDIAFAPVTQLARWIEKRQLSSERLTKIYLARLKQFDSKLRCVITLTDELALAQAKKADQEMASGHYRGPLHGIPWGAKDLLDTAGIRTTYGAEPFKNRIPAADAAVVKRLHEAGAVLGGKIKSRCAGVERYLVRRPDHESVASGRRSVGIERWSRRCDCGGPRWLCDRQRNRRQHRCPKHAMRCYRIASHLRTCPAYRSNDPVLVARQAWPHDPQCGRHHAGTARYFRS